LTDSKRDSVPENPSGFTIAASPLNPVKFELGIILIIGFSLIFIVSGSVDSQALQIILLAVYGFLSMFWLIYRVRTLMAKLDKNV